MIKVVDIEFEVASGGGKRKLVVLEDGIETHSSDFSGGKGKITVRENAVVMLQDGAGSQKEFVARSNAVPDASGGFGQLKVLGVREVEAHPVKKVIPVT